MASAVNADPHTASDPDPDHVSDHTLRDLAGYNLRRTSQIVQADLAKTLEPLGLRMITFAALVLIVDNAGVRQTRLANALAIERSNLVLIVDDLEQRGLIQRTQVPSDRRAYALVPTDEGRAMYTRALNAVHAHEAALLGNLEASEIATLISLLKRVEVPRA